jgi:histidinol-phosphate aminotransferase
VPAGRDFAFPMDSLLQAVTLQTKLIALANPNSPTGQTVTRAQILSIAEAAPHAAVLVDEAYFHFFGETVIDQVGKIPNLIVARTFSKAYGLAGLRLGMLAASEQQMRWLRRVISPYSVNSLALACLPPALKDSAYLDWYVAEVRTARADFEAALDSFAVQRWPSLANFILVRIGAQHRHFVEAMRERDVLVRDRSGDPGCEGCVRITIGTREQTRAAIAALEESLDDIGWKGHA